MKKRWIVFLSILGGLLLVSLSLATLIRTGWFRERLRTFAVHKLGELTGWEFEIENLRGNLITYVVVDNVKITQPGEVEPLAQAREIRAKYDILDLILGSKDIKHITIISPFVNVGADWRLKKKEPTSGGDSEIADFSIRSLKIQAGRVVGVPKFESIDSIDLHLSISAEENCIDFTLIRCGMNVSDLSIKTIVSQGLFEKEILKLERFQLVTDESSIDLKGVIGSQIIQLNGDTDLELQELSKLLDLPSLSGTLQSSFDIRKEEGSGSAEGTILLRRGEFDQYLLGDLKGKFSSDWNKMVIDLERWSIGNGEAEGSVEVDLKNFAVISRITATGLDLSHISGLLKDYDSDLNFEAIIDLSSTVPDLRGAANLRMNESTIRGLHLDQLSAKLNLEPEFLEIEELKFRSEGSSTHASGKIFPSAIDLKVETKGIELAQLSDIFGVEDLAGNLFADFLVQGNPRKPFIIGSFWIKKLSLPHTAIGYISGHLSYQYSKENPRINLQLSVEEGVIFDRELSNFNLSVNGEGKIFYYSADFAVEKSSIQLAGEIRSSNQETKVVNRHLVIFSNGQSITSLTDLVLVLTPKTELEKTKFSICDGWIELSGNYFSPNLIEVALVGEGINLEDLAELIGIEHVLRGHLDLNLQLKGPFFHPEFNLEVEINNFTYEYANLELVEMTVSYAHSNLDLIRVNFKGDRGAYSIRGYLPVDLSFGKTAFIDEEMELYIDLQGLESWMFQPIISYLELKECKLDGDLHIYGTPIKPKLSGALTLRNGQFYSRFLKTFLTQVKTELEFEDEEIKINSLSAKTEEGTLTAKGVLKLEKLIPETMNIEVDVVKLPVRGIEDVYALIEANLRISGELQEPSIDGTVDIDELLITTPFQQTSGHRAERRPLQFQTNISVDANRSIWIRNQNANIQLDGELKVKVKDGILILSGELNTVRGWVRYYDREFEIVKGRFKFTDIPEINPELDILAETEVVYTYVENDVRSSKRDVIRLQITGFMRTPEVILTSESGDLTELDIFSLLTLNMTWSELSSEERMDILREQAAGRVLDLAASQLTQQIRQAVGLDAFRIKVKPIGEEAGAKLTVGKYISRDLYVSYTSELFSTAKDQFRVEYFVGRRGSIVGERNEEGRYFIGLNYKFRLWP